MGTVVVAAARPRFLFRSVRRRSCSVAVAVVDAAAAAKRTKRRRPPLRQLGHRRSRQTQFRHGGSRTFRDHTHTPRRFYLFTHRTHITRPSSSPPPKNHRPQSDSRPTRPHTQKHRHDRFFFPPSSVVHRK